MNNLITSEYFPNTSLGQLVGEKILLCQFMNKTQKMFSQDKE